MIVSFDGRPEIPLRDGRRIVGRLLDRWGMLVLACEDGGGEEVWESELVELDQDPRMVHADAQTADYTYLVWPAVHAVIVMGADGALVVDIDSGRIMKIFPVDIVGKSSLDICYLALAGEEGPLVISSAKTIWVVGSDFEPMAEITPQSLIASNPSIVDGVLEVHEYDFDDPGFGQLIERFPLTS